MSILLATVTGTFKSSFTTETTTIHIYDNDFTKYGKLTPTTQQELYEYVWGIPGIIKAEINYSPVLNIREYRQAPPEIHEQFD
jgi:thymidylate synthase